MKTLLPRAVAVFLVLVVSSALLPVDASHICSVCASKMQGDCPCHLHCATVGGCQGCCVGQKNNSMGSLTKLQLWWGRLPYTTNPTTAINLRFSICLSSCEI